jgi:hypothetical protein
MSSSSKDRKPAIEGKEKQSTGGFLFFGRKSSRGNNSLGPESQPPIGVFSARTVKAETQEPQIHLVVFFEPRCST